MPHRVIIHADELGVGVEVGDVVWVGAGEFVGELVLIRYACIRLTLVPCLPW